MSTATSRDGALLALASMFTIQIGVAGSVRFLDDLGPLGAAWLRLTCAALLIVAIVRPWRYTYSAAALRAGALLGVASAGMAIFFMSAADRLPLGTAGAIEFLGPLTVAALTGRRRAAWVWPAVAGAGVLLLTRPWTGAPDLLGVVFALLSAVCYAGYIVFTERVGDESHGIKGLAVSMPVAALVITLVAGPPPLGELTWSLAVTGFALAVLVPFLPFLLELLALRRLPTAAFSTLMCLEPAFALLAGLVLLGQGAGLNDLAGVAAVVVAGIGAVRAPSCDHIDDSLSSPGKRFPPA
ncbi:membrane protein [Actinoplanes sp. OR16]|uniref:EamA family transporter n=1 Tax=Actinoplanes sp. OR16 TaxID=946334 RepID=UPI000F6C1D4C|nr:EamA family transporter [Actinoplanes sp. OR16]BBH69514.1 membrane protein [Actinoplanes sp. OR16]